MEIVQGDQGPCGFEKSRSPGCILDKSLILSTRRIDVSKTGIISRVELWIWRAQSRGPHERQSDLSPRIRHET